MFQEEHGCMDAQKLSIITKIGALHICVPTELKPQPGN